MFNETFTTQPLHLGACPGLEENLSAQLSQTQLQSATQEECLQAQSSKMSKLEALRIQIDTLKWELNQLETENARLREDNPDGDRLMDVTAE